MQTLAASAAAPYRLNEKAPLADKNTSSEELAEYVHIDLFPSNQDDLTQASKPSQAFTEKWGTSPIQDEKEPVLLKEVALTQPKRKIPIQLIVRDPITPTKLSLALEKANASRLEKTEMLTPWEKVTVPPFSVEAISIPEGITQKVGEVKNQFGPIERFIWRLSFSLLKEEDIDRLEEPGGEFKTRLGEIKTAFTEAQDQKSLKGIRSAAITLNTLISDLTTLSTNFRQSQVPDVKEAEFRLGVSTALWSVVGGCLATAAAFTVLPVITSAVIGLVAAVVLCGFRLWYMKQEHSSHIEKEKWDTYRAPLKSMQGDIEALLTQIQQEEDIMERVIDQVKNVTYATQKIADRSNEQSQTIADLRAMVMAQLEKINELTNKVEMLEKNKTGEGQPHSGNEQEEPKLRWVA